MTTAPPFVFDAHLDLAMNACRGRDVLRPAAEQPRIGREIATVGLPDLRAGRVTHLCATVFCHPAFDGRRGYSTADEAFAMAQVQMTIYAQWHAAGEIRLHETPGGAQGATLAYVLLEGADAVRTPDDLQLFYDQGVRVIGMAWQGTRYSGGTGAPGPITADGRTLVRAMDRMNFVHDASHLSEQSFWELMDLAERPIIASHSNCRAIVGDDARERHLTDAMIRRLIERDGIVGINIYDKFLLPADQFGTRRVTLADFIGHVQHVCDIAGDARHVGIGTDMDGGLGREQIPEEIASSADLPIIYDRLQAAGFGEADARAIVGENFRDFFDRALGPAA